MELYDAIALKDDLPEYGLVKGRQGTILEVFDEKYVEVEFCDNVGRTIYLGAFLKDNLELIWSSSKKNK
ncbi:MAG: DUF4926 domain-containing protein [Clostridiaceae bacterium]